MHRLLATIASALAVALALAACGEDGGQPAEPDRATQLRDAGLDFARCMREHGVEMPDPKTDENGVTIEQGGGGAGPGGAPTRRFQTAERACRKHLAELEPPKLSAEDQKEFRQRALAHAKCMREHGADFPDPKFSDDGSAVVDIGPGSGLDPQSPTFQRAQTACRKLAGMPAPGGGS